MRRNPPALVIAGGGWIGEASASIGNQRVEAGTGKGDFTCLFLFFLFLYFFLFAYECIYENGSTVGLALLCTDAVPQSMTA